ncbi:MAG: MFS transporter, partial [Candidatus Hadarchaeia archaeon]
MNSIRNLKILLLTAYMGFGIYIPFARLFFEASPLSGGQYGILMSIPGYILILSQPVWSLISDYTGSLRRNFQIMLLGSGLFLFVFFAARSFFLSNYIALLVLFGFFSIFRTGGEPIMNSLSLSFVEGTGENYGQVRLWSSVGWAVATVLGGYFFLRTSLEYLFPLSSAFFLVAALIAFPLEEPKRKTLRTMNVFKSREIKRALNNKKLWIFLIFIFLLWVGVSSADIFVPAYLERHFEFGLVGIGVFYAFQALAEVPFFYY